MDGRCMCVCVCVCEGMGFFWIIYSSVRGFGVGLDKIDGSGVEVGEYLCIESTL